MSAVKSRRRSDQSNRLTGTPRRIKDLIADLYNNIQKWKEYNNVGFNLITLISNAKVESRSKFLMNINNALKKSSEIDACYPESIEESCTKLKSNFTSMEAITAKINKITHQLVAIGEMDFDMSFDSSFTSYDSDKMVPFTSWPVDAFGDHASKINTMIQQEIKLKKSIIENIAHADFDTNGDILSQDDARDISMTYTAAWLHEPFVDSNDFELYLTELLIESGHK